MSANRFAHVNAIETASQYGTLQDYAEVRRKQFDLLSEPNKAWLKYLEQHYGVDETRQIYLLFIALDSDRGAHYSGCSPYAQALRVVSKFETYCVPIYCFPMNGEISYPDFTNGYLSRLRTAEFDSPTKTWKYKSGCRDFSEYEQLETYFGILTGTLRGFMCGQLNDLKPISLLLMTMNNTVAGFQSLWSGTLGFDAVVEDNEGLEVKGVDVKDAKDENKDAPSLLPYVPKESEIKSLENELLTRDIDKQQQFAKRLRSLNNIEKIRSFYILFTATAKHNPQVLHPSVWPRLEYFLFGMLLFQNDEHVIDQMRECVLTAIFNRFLRSAPKLSESDLTQFTDSNALSHFVIEKSAYIVNSLRYWAFIVQFCLLQNRLGAKCMQVPAFGNQAEWIRERIQNCPAINVLTTSIAPSSGKTVTPQMLADFLLTAQAAKYDEKHYATASLNEKCVTLLARIEANLKIISDAKAIVEKLRMADNENAREASVKDVKDVKQEKEGRKDVKDVKDVTDLKDVKDIKDVKDVKKDEKKDVQVYDSVWDKHCRTITETNVPNVYTQNSCTPLYEQVMQLAAAGTPFSLEKLRGIEQIYILDQGAYKQWRFFKQILYVTPEDSAVYSYYNLKAGSRCKYPIGRAAGGERMLMNRYRKGIHVELAQAKAKVYQFQKVEKDGKEKDGKEKDGGKEDEKEEVLRGIPIQIKPFDPSCVLLGKILKLTESERMCLICCERLNKANPSKLLHAKTGDAKHQTCQGCYKRLKSDGAVCPFCRADIQ